jgi:hypothetical protein
MVFGGLFELISELAASYGIEEAGLTTAVTG